MISIDELRVQYSSRGRHASFTLSITGFHVQPGEIVAVVGHSGCGKSTLLKALIGDLTPSHYAGEPLAQLWAPLRTGYIAQQHCLIPWRTSAENVAYPLELVRPAEPRRRRIAAATSHLGRFGLRYAVEKYPDQLSLGMAKRVELARATVYEPSLLIMDEPMSGLDIHVVDKIIDQVIAPLRDTGCAIVWVTHDLVDASLVSDCIYWFDQAGKWSERAIPGCASPSSKNRFSPAVQERAARLRRNMYGY